MKQKKSAVVPRLRFPEFRSDDDWENATLSDIATFHKGRGIAKADIDPSGLRPCIRYGELYTRYGEVIRDVHSRTSVADVELFLSESNDVIVPASGETKDDIATASCVLLEGVALGSDLNVIRSVQHGAFLSYTLNGPLKRQIAKLAQGDTVVHLYPRQLQSLWVSFPGVAEQQKIADCLTSLDEVIAAQGRKVEALKSYKRGLTQQLFPREGETVPRLRFSEFSGSTDWLSARIGTLMLKVSHPVAVQSDELYREIGIRSHGRGVFHKEPVLGKVLGEKRVFRIVQDALVVNIVFAWEQAVATTSEREVGKIASHRFPMYVAKTGKCDVRFLKAYFLTKAGKHKLGLASPGGAGRNKTLGQKDFEDLKVGLPPTVREQAAIADCIATLDTDIFLEVEKLESLQKHKRALMHQLFPSAEPSPG